MTHQRARGRLILRCMTVGVAIGLALSLPGVVGTLGGYELMSSAWYNDPELRISTISFPDGTQWRADLVNGVDRWNSMMGMGLEFTTSFSGYTSFSIGNGHNDVAFVSGSDIDYAWGETETESDGDETEETDVMFNAELAWKSSAQDERYRSGTNPAFRKVVVHELGHSIGLDHSCDRLTPMMQGYGGEVWFGGNAATRHHPTPDAAAGARALYATSNSETDVTLTNMKMDGSCGSQLWRDNAQLTTVAAGDQVSVEYTVANVGNVGASFAVGVYLSGDDYISTADTYLGGVGYYLSKQSTAEQSSTYRMPCSVKPGTYYIGAVADPQNLLNEQRESNNTLVFPGKWQITAPVALPDLVVDEVYMYPLHPTVHDSISFSALVRNVGCAATKVPSMVSFRIGGETTPVSFTIPALEPQQATSVHRRVLLGVARQYINTISVDANGLVAESKETNNVRLHKYAVAP